MFGILNIHKPEKWTSRDVVNHVAKMCRRHVKTDVRVGHAGTLDPLATGVLLVCVGPATKLVPWIHTHRKSYMATFLLGRRSITDDVEGEIELLEFASEVDAQSLRTLIPEFTGQIQQVPPQVSAKKIDGRRAYVLAKQGTVVPLPPQPVLIHRLEMTAFSYPQFTLEVECSSGTYIRALGRDLAARLGTGAVLSELQRTAIGPFHLNDAIPLESLSASNIGDHVLSPLSALTHLPWIEVTAEKAEKIKCGLKYPLSVVGAAPHQPDVVVTFEGQLICMATCRDVDLKPNVVFKQLSTT